MSLMMVGTIQADEGAGPTSRAESRDVAPNAAFTTDIDLLEEGTDMVYNLTGADGVFTVDAATTYTFVTDNVTNVTVYDEGNFTATLTTTAPFTITLSPTNTSVIADHAAAMVSVWATNMTNQSNVSKVDLMVTLKNSKHPIHCFLLLMTKNTNLKLKTKMKMKTVLIMMNKK